MGKKPDMKVHIMCDSIYIRSIPDRSICRDRKQISVCPGAEGRQREFDYFVSWEFPFVVMTQLDSGSVDDLVNVPKDTEPPTWEW